MYLLGGFEGMLIHQFEVYFDMIFLSENSRNLHLLHKNKAISAKPLLGSLGTE